VDVQYAGEVELRRGTLRLNFQQLNAGRARWFGLAGFVMSLYRMKLLLQLFPAAKNRVSSTILLFS